MAQSKDSSGLECCDITECYMDQTLLTPHTSAGLLTQWAVPYHCDFVHWVHLLQALHRKWTGMRSLVNYLNLVE